MNRLTYTACAGAMLLLAGCGSKDAGKAATIGAAHATQAAPSATASAEQVAKEMRGKVSCPAKIVSKRPDGAPVDDVVGVRPGMTWDEAVNVVLCDNPLLVVTENTDRGYNINTFGHHIRQGFDAKFAEPRVQKTGRDLVKEMEEEAVRRGTNTRIVPLKPGQSRYYVSTMGPPGQERVISVAREEYYPDGKLPTVSGLKDALVAKYGEPSLIQGSGNMLYWEYDPKGEKLKQGSTLAGTCSIAVSPDAGTSLSTNCGLTVGAQITPATQNAGLAHSLAVASLNGAVGYALIQVTVNALEQADAARKAKELQDAAKGAAAPKL